MIGQPAAGGVCRFPGGIAGVVNRELVAQVQPLVEQGRGRDTPRRDRLLGNVVKPVPRGVAVAAGVVGAVPPGDVVARREPRLGDEVPHALAVRILDHQRDVSRLGQLESHRDRRMRFFGVHRRHERRLRRSASPKRTEGHQFAQPDALPSAVRP